MLVLTRKILESLVINDRLFVVPTKTFRDRSNCQPLFIEPFDARTGNDLGTSKAIPIDRTNYEFALKPDECIVINDEITVVFIVARIGEGDALVKARFGLESISRTKLQCRNATGAIVHEYEFGLKPYKQLR